MSIFLHEASLLANALPLEVMCPEAGNEVASSAEVSLLREIGFIRCWLCSLLLLLEESRDCCWRSCWKQNGNVSTSRSLKTGAEGEEEGKGEREEHGMEVSGCRNRAFCSDGEVWIRLCHVLFVLCAEVRSVRVSSCRSIDSRSSGTARVASMMICGGCCEVVCV